MDQRLPNNMKILIQMTKPMIRQLPKKVELPDEKEDS